MRPTFLLRAPLLLLLLMGTVLAVAQPNQRMWIRKDMLVTTLWLAENLSNPDIAILHIAEKREEFDSGHIPGALFVPWNEVIATRDGIPNELPPLADLAKLFTRLGVAGKKRIVLYGDKQGLSAARTYFTLDYLGYGDVATVLDGGLEKWKADGRATSTTAAEPTPAAFVPKVKPQVVTFLSVARDVSWALTPGDGSGFTGYQPETLLVDARPPEEFSGEKPGEGVDRPGHIPGAISAFWMDNVQSKEMPVMKTDEELTILYQEKGVGWSQGKRVVVYCRTGGQASHAYFTLKYLGYDVVLYDGSYFEWQRQKDTPVIGPADR